MVVEGSWVVGYKDLCLEFKVQNLGFRDDEVLGLKGCDGCIIV